MPKALVIVESPAKARTIAGFLGKGYVVESSIGHIRDLPKRAGDVPAKFKKAAWARLGVDVENGFKPLYVVDPDKRSHVAHLKSLLKDADVLYLATDEDREGESIAWHLVEVLAPKVPVKRMVFHEITKKAIAEAIESPRDIDQRLVNAQEARRILDRLYGYEVSPVLWKKIMPKLSAGRVQSVATRIIVDRERARMRFRAARYWDVVGTFGAAETDFTATLMEVDGRRLATGKDFGETGGLKKDDVLVLDEARAASLARELPDGKFSVKSVERKPYKRSPYAPFMTSTLQQEASRKLRLSASRTMQIAQRLYENGYITYMRTDSTTLSETAINAARTQIKDLYGADYMPPKPRTHKHKVKNAQEAHEAIRPAGDSFRKPADLTGKLNPTEAQLYELIWKRTMASQMEDARGESIQVRIEGKAPSGTSTTFSVGGKTITFPGFLRAYVEGSDDPNADLEDREKHLPDLTEGGSLKGKAFEPKDHETQPPARFTEASLVRRLEELGVGRPSTYASIITTIQDRGYVWKKASALIPSFKAFAVVTLLEKHFPDLVDYAFTARMEDDLDAIAGGSKETVPWLRHFYFGEAHSTPANANGVRMDMGLHSLVSEQLGEIDARAINSILIGTDSEGRDIIVRVGRYGPYLQRGEDTASIPEDHPPDELSLEKAIQLLEAPSGDRTIGKDPETGLSVLVKAGRFGTYVQLGEPDADSKDKPKTASLFRTMSAETVSLEEALRLLSLPRTVGNDPADATTVTAQNGRYGPYISKGTDSRSLESEEQLFTITLGQALDLLKQPKQRGRGAAKAPLRELGADPTTGKVMLIKDGRFGPYVTDGETNASLRKDDSVEELTIERGCELLQIRRERGPVKKKATKKRATKKRATKKKATKKKATKKKATEKKATKKAKAKSSDAEAGA